MWSGLESVGNWLGSLLSKFGKYLENSGINTEDLMYDVAIVIVNIIFWVYLPMFWPIPYFRETSYVVFCASVFYVSAWSLGVVAGHQLDESAIRHRKTVANAKSAETLVVPTISPSSTVVSPEETSEETSEEKLEGGGNPQG